MKRFSFVRGVTASAASSAVAASGVGSCFLAGGTTLYDLMKLGIEQPGQVIDINGLRDLDDQVSEGSAELVLGSLARMSDVAAHPVVRERYPAVSESLWKAASQQLRNMASLGGNLLQRTRCAYYRGGAPYACNKRQPGSGCSALEGIDRMHAVLGGSGSCIATYPGDFAIALVAFDAVVDIVGSRGRRSVPVEQLHLEPGDTPHIETQLAPGELIASIRIPFSPLGKASTFHKLRDRESYAFALASAAVALRVEGGVVSDARIALGGLATRPWRARVAEQSLVGRPLSEEAARAAGNQALDGARAGRHNAFRIELGRRVVADALFIAAGRV